MQSRKYADYADCKFTGMQVCRYEGMKLCEYASIISIEVCKLYTVVHGCSSLYKDAEGWTLLYNLVHCCTRL